MAGYAGFVQYVNRPSPSAMMGICHLIPTGLILTSTRTNPIPLRAPLPALPFRPLFVDVALLCSLKMGISL